MEEHLWAMCIYKLLEKDSLGYTIIRNVKGDKVVGGIG